MRFKKLLLIVLSVFLTTCSTGPSSLPQTSKAVSVSSFFSSMPSGNELVFIGAVGRRSNRADTLKLAIEDAAKRVAIFHGVYGEYAVEINVGSGAFDYTNNVYSAMYFNEGGSSQYIDSLKYNVSIDTIEIDNVFFIRTTYTSALPYPVNYRPTYNREGKPDWIENPPHQINGYEVGVGFAGRHSSMADTYTVSRNNAIYAIIRNINSVLQSRDTLYLNSGNLFGYKTSNDNVISSYGTLNGFYVLDTWIDQTTKTIWTLAVARKP
jgi:hypothetical protein